MKITFSPKPVTDAPKEYVRVRITEEKHAPRFVREGNSEWLEFGVGPWKDANQRRFIILCRRVIRTAKQHQVKKLALEMGAFPLAKDEARSKPELAALMAENFEMANFEFTTFKKKPREGWNMLDEILICGETSKETKAGYARGQMIGESVNACRALANMPGGSMTPRKLAQAAKDAVKGTKVTVKVLGRKEMEVLGMGALLGVANGSEEEPTFTIMEYKGTTAKNSKPIVLAGKGITFDSGGLNLKPSNSIYEMHMDMSGAAAVMHTVALAAKLGVSKHVIGLLPSAENMPGNGAYRPGDILNSLSGKTIEVLNTDAEGRLVLADAITYAKRLNPSALIDVATLTGAAVVALGLYASGLLTRDDALAEELLANGEASGDYLWRLPLWDEYEDMIKSEFADMANIATGASARYGGATEGGVFLWQFAKELDCPWAHLDIAPRMTAAPGDELAKGAAGAPVRLLLRFIESWKG